jgi:hypothetical protein
MFVDSILEVLFGPILKKLQQHKHNGCLVIGVIWALFYKIVATQTKAHLVVEVLWAQFYKNCSNTNKGPLENMIWINFKKFIAIK